MPDARASLASTTSLARLYTWCLRGADHVHAHRLAVGLIGAPLAITDPRGHQPAGPARLPQLRRRVRLSLSGQDDGGGTPVEPHRDPGRHLRVQLHRAGARAHVRQLPGGLAAGAGRGDRGARAGLAGQPRARGAHARAGVAARRAPLLRRAWVCSRPGSWRSRRSSLSTPRRTSRTPSAARCCSVRPVLRRARTARRGGCRFRSACSSAGRCSLVTLRGGRRGADCAVAAAAGREPGPHRSVGGARQPALDRGPDGLQHRAQRQPVAAHDHADYLFALVRRRRRAARRRHPRDASVASLVVDASDAHRRLSRVSPASHLARRAAGCSSGC